MTVRGRRRKVKEGQKTRERKDEGRSREKSKITIEGGKIRRKRKKDRKENR